MNHDLCLKCEHFKFVANKPYCNIEYQSRISLELSKEGYIIKPDIRSIINDSDFALFIAGMPNPDFITPEECPYILEHIIETQPA